MEDKQYFVYVLENDKGRRYVGYSENVAVRLTQHNDGLSNWTSSYRPWRLVWTSEALDRKGAFELEQRLKRQGRGSGFYRLTGLSKPSGS